MAQTLTGAIGGTIKDEQGAVLPGVTVTLTGKQGTQTQVTEANGNYRFPALEVGTLQVSAELSGFAKMTQGNLQISPGRELNIDLQMKVAGLAERTSPWSAIRRWSTSRAAQPRRRSRSRCSQRTDHPHGDQCDQLCARREQQLGVRWRRRLGQLAADRRRRRDPEGGTAWTFYNYNMVEEYQFQGLGAPAEYGGYTGAVGQHDHQVGW